MALHCHHNHHHHHHHCRRLDNQHRHHHHQKHHCHHHCNCHGDHSCHCCCCLKFIITIFCCFCYHLISSDFPVFCSVESAKDGSKKEEVWIIKYSLIVSFGDSFFFCFLNYCCVHFSKYLTGDVFIFVPQIEGDVLLVCVGRRPYTKRLGLEACVMQYC